MIVVLLVGSQPTGLELNVVLDGQHLHITQTVNHAEEGVEEAVVLQGGDEEGQGDVVPRCENDNSISLAGFLLILQSLYKAVQSFPLWDTVNIAVITPGPFLVFPAV